MFKPDLATNYRPSDTAATTISLLSSLKLAQTVLAYSILSILSVPSITSIIKLILTVGIALARLGCCGRLSW